MNRSNENLNTDNNNKKKKNLFAAGGNRFNNNKRFSIIKVFFTYKTFQNYFNYFMKYRVVYNKASFIETLIIK